MDGFLELGLERRGEGTEVVVSRARAPFHYLPPARGERGRAHLTIVNSSGGVLGGDRLVTTVRIGAGAELSLRTQSATRVHRTASGGARAWQHLHLGRDARLEFLPDEIIPFAGSDYVQETTIELEPGATAVLAEIAAAGRLARDERFAFRRLAVALRCSVAGRLALCDRYDLEPARHRIDGAGILGGASVWGSFYLLSAGPIAPVLVEAVDQAFAAVPGGSGGATTTPIGIVARAVAAGVEPIRAAIERARDLTAGATLHPDLAGFADLAQETA